MLLLANRQQKDYRHGDRQHLLSMQEKVRLAEELQAAKEASVQAVAEVCAYVAVLGPVNHCGISSMRSGTLHFGS